MTDPHWSHKAALDDDDDGLWQAFLAVFVSSAIMLFALYGAYHAGADVVEWWHTETNQGE